MIPYDLIMPSATRPHLFEPTLRTLLAAVEVPPSRILIHDDVVFPDRRGMVEQIARAIVGDSLPVIVKESDPPVTHGHALAWLLDHARSHYVLYSQDDFETIASLPIDRALMVMDWNGLHQIRFNKRHTMDKKGPEGKEFFKREVQYLCSEECEEGEYDRPGHTLCVADHWYFQTGLWRVDRLRPFVRAWMDGDPAEYREHAEAKLNAVMDGRVGYIQADGAIPSHLDHTDPRVRDVYAKTYIWGPVGEAPYIRHLGDKPEDYAMYRQREDAAGILKWSGPDRAKAKDYSAEGH